MSADNSVGTPQEGTATLKAGRELDALVAEKVMGAQPAPWVWVPRYSTDIAAAWKVVEKFTGEDSFVSVSWEMDEWVCTIGDDYKQTADTAPLAICLAALKAVEISDAR